MCSSNLLKAGNPCKLTFSRSCSDYDKMFKGTNARRMNVFAGSILLTIDFVVNLC